MNNELTVGKLKSVIECLPDNSVVQLSSDTGVDQGNNGGEVLIEDAYVTGTDKKILNIYANELMSDNEIDDLMNIYDME